MSIKMLMSKAEFLFFREAVNEKFNSWMEEMDDAEEESNRPVRTTIFTLSPERVRAMKEAGFWDDPEKRDQMIKRFYQGDLDETQKPMDKKQETAPAEKTKKPHWTQTEKGKKIMANRKPRGSKK